MDKQKNTSAQWWEVVNACKQLFIKKDKDYGSLPWRILRTPSMIDQIFIKVKRIIEVQEAGKQLVNDPLRGEFIGIINYCTMGLINLADPSRGALSPEEAITRYQTVAQATHDLMIRKNHDYGEAWRDFGETTFPDLIMQKLIRVKSILKNGGKTIASEGIEANYMDMINYAVFALILENEKLNNKNV